MCVKSGLVCTMRAFSLIAELTERFPIIAPLPAKDSQSTETQKKKEDGPFLTRAEIPRFLGFSAKVRWSSSSSS